MRVLRRLSALALALVACGNGYSEADHAVVPPADAGTTPDARTTPDAAVDLIANVDSGPPACKLSEPFAAPEIVGGFGEIDATFPSLSADELTIIVAGGDATGAAVILIAERPAATGAFPVAPRVIHATNLDGSETSATLSADGLELIFASAPPSSFFSRLYRSTRTSRAVDFGSSVALTGTAGAGLSQNAPSLLPDNRGMYLSAVVDDKHWQIQRASRTSTDFDKPLALAGIDDALARQYGVTTTADELTIYFSSNRASGDTNIYLATRANVSDPFGSPRPVEKLNSTSEDLASWVSRDGCRLYFASNRSGPNRIYVAAKP